MKSSVPAGECQAGLHPRAVLFETGAGASYRAGRSRRCLESLGLAAEEHGELNPDGFRELLRGGGPLLLLRAGAWLVRTEGFRLPPSSATGKGLCAFGAVKAPAETEPQTVRAAQLWKEWLGRTGGNFTAEGLSTAFPPVACVYLDERAVAVLRTRNVSSFEELLGDAAELRFVYYPTLDVYEDAGLRVLQVITALQRGGAERLTLDLLAELPTQNVRTRLATLGRPLREAFALPPGTLELSRAGGTPESRAAALIQAAIQFGADVVHAHLIVGEAVRRLAQAGFPTVVTVHNLRAGWPEGMASLGAERGVMLAACAQAVEADLRATQVPLPVRTVWNGIDLKAFEPTAERQAAGERWRKAWGFRAADVVLVAVANPRPQKRLERLPAILAALRARLGSKREARLVLCGEAMPGNPEAERCVAETRAEVARLHLKAHVRWTGPVAEVAELLAAADVLVSTSAHEGLSLAQLEALAMGCAVVATDVGGAREIAWGHPRMQLVAPEAGPEEIAQVLERVVNATHAQQSPLQVGRAVPSAPPTAETFCSIRNAWNIRGALGTARPTTSALKDASLEAWSRTHMTARYRLLYPRVIAAARRGGGGRGLWLITNNFSTGGAQSSARRLLLGLAAQQVPVRAAVIEEDPGNPTPGRRALQAAGIRVLSIPAAEAHDIAGAAEGLLAAIDADPPQVVLFWNLRPAFKVLLADALLDVPVFDVSPGEMFFASLEQFFTKAHPGLSYRTAREYGARLAGVIVKYSAEAEQAAKILGAPVHVVPNGVPLSAEGLEAPGARSELRIGTAARLNPQKRLEDLLEALHLAHDRMPAYRLKIAGGVERGCDAYATGLRKLADGLPIDWLGETADVAAFHRELDLFAMISEPAGCPNASLEAMAAGLPVVATDVGGAAEQVLDGCTGRLVAARAPAALAEALVELAHAPEVRRQMGVAARERIREHFSVERMVADYRRICLPG